MIRWCRAHPLIAFFVLAYALAWLAWAPLVLSRTALGWLPFDAPMQLTVPGSYAPLAAALLVRWLQARDLRVARLWPSAPGLVTGLLVGTALVALTFVVLPGTWLGNASSALDWVALWTYPAGILHSALMAGPIGEEPGWRGFALPQMQAAWGPLPANLLLGVLWASWHAPLFLIPGWPAASVYLPMVIGLAVLIGFCFNLSRGSVLVAIAMHAAFNASSPILGRFLGDAPLRTGISPLAALAISFAGVALALVAATRARLAWRPAPTASPSSQESSP
jgi:membrane protease YdiL (CAAX protease family)